MEQKIQVNDLSNISWLPSLSRAARADKDRGREEVQGGA